MLLLRVYIYIYINIGFKLYLCPLPQFRVDFSCPSYCPVSHHASMQDENPEEITVCTSLMEARNKRDAAMSSAAYQDASQVWVCYISYKQQYSSCHVLALKDGI